jgi:dihydrofolate reductase
VRGRADEGRWTIFDKVDVPGHPRSTDVMNEGPAMAHVIHSINTTLNGGCHHEDVVADREHHGYALELLTRAEGVLLGRATFDLFADYWPEAIARPDLPPDVRALARELLAKPKYVLSSRDLETDWRNTHRLRGPSLDPVRELLAGTAGSLVVFGSPALGTSLAVADLLDEVHLVLQPFVSAGTRRVYEWVGDRKALTLLEVRSFESGVTLLRYASGGRKTVTEHP